LWGERFWTTEKLKNFKNKKKHFKSVEIQKTLNNNTKSVKALTMNYDTCKKLTNNKITTRRCCITSICNIF
jgi:hypothetical protein